MNAEEKRQEIIKLMQDASNDFSSREALLPDIDRAGFYEKTTGTPEPIAIIGMSGYFPQCKNIREFWDALDADRKLIQEIPVSRIDWDKNYDADKKDFNKSHTKWGGIIPDIQKFDPQFFGILPGDAAVMDPRIRLLMMSTYHALEDAGYSPKSFDKNAGVFVAIEEDEYRQYLLERGMDLKSGNGHSSSLIANQLSYFFDFKGPSEVINTMCSGAAVAIHRAVRALRSGEISHAVVGGANLLLHEDPFIFLSRTGQMSPTDSVNSFGKGARGFLRADGVGVIILKPLQQAEAEKDSIYAVIKNTAVNFNGRGGMSMAAPNISSHAGVIQSCYEGAGIDPRHVSYIEAQGMGNPVADLAEWEACNKALKAIAAKKNLAMRNGSCTVSTIKPMTGHMHSASALGALLRIVRSFQTNKIHKIIDLKEINSDLDINDQPCRLATETQYWPDEDFPRLAGLHSYGSGGNNAHILVEEYKHYKNKTGPVSNTGKVVIPVSAQTEKQCADIVRALLDVVLQNPEYDIASVAHTMQVGRDSMKHRIAFMVNSREQFIDEAKNYLANGSVDTTTLQLSVDQENADDIVLATAAWLEGHEIVWSKMQFKGNVNRLHLPVYPFNCQDYWVGYDDQVLNEKPFAELKKRETISGVSLDDSSVASSTCKGTKDAIDPGANGSRKNRKDVLAYAEQIVRKVLSSYLSTSPLDIDLNTEFSRMGFDSLLVVNLTQRFQQQYGLKLEPSIFFEHTTPHQLALFLTDSLYDQLLTNTPVADKALVAKDRNKKGPVPSADELSPGAQKSAVKHEQIAIIGLAGSFPQSADLELFWKNIIEGNNCIEEVPAERWLVEQHFHPDREVAGKTGRSYGKWGGFMKDLYFFDPLFFNISPSEAETMNPKERMFLQCSWHVMEDAGYSPQTLLHEQVGVFVGVTRSGRDPYQVSTFPVANRVSYTFNFKGPSMPIDTACSSSLIAVHEACQHILAGECTVAIAGGVHAFLDPSHFAALSALQMLSPDGITRSFGDQANGMVPGEGVGAVMLKSLSRAIADGDNIYAIIRGSATNHGGKANGFTVPNPKAHAELIRHALTKANVNAREINYVEAHGTGTSLGDPIEIRGLSEAFKTTTDDFQYCPIGSVKSNIGHLEAAAGISGLTKILLQMKYRRLAPSLHSAKLSPQIDFAKTPFIVQQAAVDWQPVDKDGNQIPRIACVSSFGAGGSNAHIIVEECRPGVVQKTANPAASGIPAIILLSAKTDKQVRERAGQLLSFLENQSENEDDLLYNIAYTLQIGREAMEERIAFRVTSLAELKTKLTLIAQGSVNIPGNVYAGNTKKHKDTLSLICSDPEMENLVQSWLKTGYYDQVLSLWVKGLSFNWQELYQPNITSLRRISLPVYPFLKEYFGLPKGVQNGKNKKSSLAGSSPIHSLIHQNISTFSEQKFTSIFDGEEFFLKDHVINARKTLPGVAYLEMIHEAMYLAEKDELEGAAGLAIQLTNVAWTQPVFVGHQSVQLTTSLLPSENGLVNFEISTHGKESSEDCIVHSQGSARFIENSGCPVLEIDRMKASADRAAFSADQCYAEFDKMGIHYGPSHRGIKNIYVGKDHTLAKLALPDGMTDTLTHFSLHPSLMDAAFQAVMGFVVMTAGNADESLPIAVPFALEELIVFEKCSATMWACIQLHDSESKVNSLSDINNLSFDIDLCDDHGKVCVRMKGFTSRIIRNNGSGDKNDSILFLRPSWEAEPITADIDRIQYVEHVVLHPEGLIPGSTTSENMRLISVACEIDEKFVIADYTVRVFRVIKDLLNSKPKGKILVQVLTPVVSGGEMLVAISGLLKSAHMENPQFHGQVVTNEQDAEVDLLLRRLHQNSQYPEVQQIQYVNGQRFVWKLIEYPRNQKVSIHPWKDGGVYIITGGKGGLGFVFAGEIVRKVKNAVVVLMGRSDLDAIGMDQIRNLEANDATVEYRRVDVIDRKSVDDVIKDILQHYGRINGIMHCAGTLRDNFILKKTEQEIREVLGPKVQGLTNIDQATKDIPLDFFVTFSSVAGVMGNAGQSDYAVANAFMDEYMKYRNILVSNSERTGLTVSINWPLWKEGGMSVSNEIEKTMADSFGMHSLKTTAGLQAFYEIMSSGNNQMMVVQGDVKLLRRTFLSELSRQEKRASIARDNAASSDGINADVPDLNDKAIGYFKKVLSGVIKLSPDRIEADATMDEYGIDSIMVTKMTSELEKVFGSLPKTLFFEYQNIRELTQYFLSSHIEKVQQLLEPGSTGSTANKPEEKKEFSEDLKANDKLRRRRRFSAIPAKPDEKKTGNHSLDIAIIGVSGRYPQARNLQEFWDNLLNGRNCITEVPKERWDHSLYFDPDKNKTGKTNTKWGGFLDGVDEFDALFFNISPLEAEITDPQERLFLQCAFETLEDAGYTRHLLGKNPVDGRVGVFAGVMWTEYQLYGAQSTLLGKPQVLSSGAASIANRVSYFCNFNGPSLGIDTMCSSSLTAIHMACRSIAGGECEVALAGGVNASIHPNKYLVLGHGKLASSKGLCESFGKNGDGYVASEGVGTILLKPLHKAIADGDQIYGVIKGTAINHGGKVNGYSVPNPKAQASVISQALRESGFDARTISYIEAHGTGTALGDPIEIAGLTSGFATKEKLFCAIGSAKSNIGHCESAAGIAGVTKVLLQMKHRKLVPSLHSAELNENIDFQNSPFVVQQELTEWKRPVIREAGEAREYPLRAGISSFGAGGSNAHIIIEEYIPEESIARGNNSIGSPNHALIVLSAKSDDRLKALAMLWVAAIRQNHYSEKDLADIAYTLQVGREAMEERLAVEVTSLNELAEKLTSFVQGETGVENLYVGKVKQHKDILQFFASDDDIEKTVESWLMKKKYAKLLGLWVNGMEISWEKLHTATGGTLRRISLPTYPFSRNRYWPVGNINLADIRPTALSFLHPLVHENTSTFSEQKFNSLFTGKEFFLKDHIVDGEKLLPGVAYLEIVNEAMAIAGGQKRAAIQIENMVWVKPLMVNGHPEKITVRMSPHENGTVGFEISSGFSDSTGKETTHSQGVARFVEPADSTLSVDVDSLRATASGRVLTARECYELFTRMGIDYGPSQQAIENIYVGEGYVLARLCLPECITDTLDQYCLHPSLVDASLQSVIGFLFNRFTESGEIPLAIPFAVKSVEIFGKCTSRMWAFVRQNNKQDDRQKTSDLPDISFDIDVVDESGNVCIQMREYTARVIGRNKMLSTQGILMIEPVWKQKEVPITSETIHYGQRHVIVIEDDKIAGVIKTTLRDVNVVLLSSPQLSPEHAFHKYALDIFSRIKAILQGRPKSKVLIQILIPSTGERQVFAALAGLLNTAQLENPFLTGQIIYNDEGKVDGSIIAKLKENEISPSDMVIRYENGRRETFDLKKIEATETPANHIWKDNGVYLITGGTGGLGIIFANEIARKTKKATVILAGRSSLNAEREEQLIKIRAQGVTVEYLQTDVADLTSVNALIQYILQEYGTLHGIIHSAGVLRDSFILKKTEEEITEVLAPKVSGVTNLDLASREIALEFLILCSSTTGITGNPGQADYALANAYMDWFARHRNSLVLKKQRSGRCISVNWPLWKNGGMQVTEEQEQILFHNFGMVPLETDAAFDALYRVMATDAKQLMLFQGDLKKLHSVFLQHSAKDIEPHRVAKTENKSGKHGREAENEASERSRNLAFFTKVLSATIKLPFDQINVDKPLEEYGIDSVMVMRMTNELEKVFGSLSKTLFFEHQTIHELTEYFEGAFPEKIRSLTEADERSKETNGNPVVHKSSKAAHVAISPGRFKNLIPQKPESETDANEIAIVGLSGSYPQARDIRSFWNALKGGKNCITEVPLNRWDHSQYFAKGKNIPGKTYSRWGGFLEGVEEFDPIFFGITPREAATMDPQERIFLQCVYETLEDAGYTKERLGYNKAKGSSGNVGVYVGVMNEEYQLYGSQETALGRPLVLSGNSAAIANRISYFFNFNGPSIAVNTMCSSSLTAVHLACQSLLLGECEAAIAGGVNVTVHPNKYLALSYGNFLSTKGLCESFGAGGDGYVPGEGVGAILLKPLSKAVADNDHIYGVIKGTAVNHGGKTNGYTVPNPKAQSIVIGKAMKMAGFDPRTVSYLEAHGTGTALGDPIEITGLNKAFETDEKGFCSIGSVKSNIGHCEGAAGIAGITKVLLQLHHRQLVPSLHTEALNPNIDFENSPFVVQRSLADWKRPGVMKNGKMVEHPRRAGISSFGAGGANAHVLIEEYIPASIDSSVSLSSYVPPRSVMVMLSAKSGAQLKLQAEKLVEWIRESKQHSTQKLVDMAYTLQTGREAMEERLALEVTTFPDLETKLEEFLQGKEGIGQVYIGQVNENSEAMIRAIDDDLANAVEEWMRTKQYGKLLSLWVKGLPVDWSKLYADEPDTYQPRKISLPTYSFARKRCWFSQSSDGMNAEGNSRTSVQQSESVLLKKQWKEAAPVLQAGPYRHMGILHSFETKAIAHGLLQNFPNSILIDIESPEAFLPEQLEQQDWSKLNGLVDLIGCGDRIIESLDWIKWLQCLIEHGDKSEIRMLCVTKGLTAFQNDHINLSGATHAGLFRMLGNEYRSVISRHIDVDPESSADVMIKLIADEFSMVENASEVCYRDRKRYQSQYGEFSINTLPEEKFTFSGDQVLWVTGGTRGLGYLCARHFVTQYGVKKLVLSGREELPSRDQWNKFQEQDSVVGQKIRNILALEAHGAIVKVVSTPLTDKNSLSEVVRDIRNSWGAIHGVVHCAGTGDHHNPAFIRKSIGDIRNVLSPKVNGLNNLYECLSKEPLSFFILFSSVSAAIPSLGAGQSAYSMSNAYMDHFAEATHRNCPMISIQWPSWKETGMGEIRTKAYQQTGLQSLTDAEGLHLLDIVIGMRMNAGPVVMPAKISRHLWRPEKLLKRTGAENATVDLPEIDTDRQQNTGHDQGSLVTKVMNWLTDLVSRELKIDAADLKSDKPFQDYGIDSIHIMQLLQPIKKTLEQDVDPSILYEYPTIRAFSDWLAKTYQEKLANVLFSTSEHTNERTQANGMSPSSVSIQANSHPLKASARQNKHGGDIAVVGMSCRFPGAENLSMYWKLLAEGNSGIDVVPDDRWVNTGNYVAGLIDDPYYFDPKFFLLQEEDAKGMDPQAFLVLEETLKLFHHAGYTPAELKGKPVGIYLGGRSNHSPGPGRLARMRNPIIAVGQNYLSANVSQFFDLRGPSLVIDTACSSALVGMNMAIQALQHGEIEAAVVGGVSLLNTDETHRLFSQRGILSKGKKFHLFDQRANGIVLGEGIGMVLLKAMDQALLDGDHIYATIKAVAINSDGRSAGPATPNIEAQKEVMRAGLAKAGKQPGEISYIEANGSGSEVTDLIELKAINSVYRSSDKTPCGLGSAKPNIGHTLCAEGIASFLKLVLMLHHKQFVPFLSGQQPMKFFNIESSPFQFFRTPAIWPGPVRAAALNCFADGGTNAHVILESSELTQEKRTIRKPVPIPHLSRVDLRENITLIPSAGEISENDFASNPRVYETVWETFK